MHFFLKKHSVDYIRTVLLSWLEIGEIPFPLSNSCAVLVSDEEIIVIGGREENGSDSDVVYRVFLEEKMH